MFENYNLNTLPPILSFKNSLESSGEKEAKFSIPKASSSKGKKRSQSSSQAEKEQSEVRKRKLKLVNIHLNIFLILFHKPILLFSFVKNTTFITGTASL